MIPGIDLEGVTGWFGEHVPEARPPLEVRLIAGGRSNLTYRVADAAGAAWVLRRPPLSGVLPSAHDMGREHRVISALAGTPVPVPATEAPGCALDLKDAKAPAGPVTYHGQVERLVHHDEQELVVMAEHRQRLL